MLIQSSLRGSIEETWQQCPKWEKNPVGGYEEVVPVIVGNRNTDDRCSLNIASSCSQLSTISNMSENSRPAFVYKRRKLQKNAVSVFQALTSANLSGGCISAIRSEGPSVVGKEGRMVSVMPPVECGREVPVLNSESISGRLGGEEPGLKDALKSDIHGALDFGCVNDSYSSSKSNVELGSSSLRIEVDDTGECSSSSALVEDGVHEDQSEKEICISILRSQGQLEGVLPARLHPSAGTPETRFDSSYAWTCKVCDHPETTGKMLICDLCEGAFHVSCCNPRMRKIPVDEWYCHSCSKKKHKILKEDTKSKTVNISSESSRSRNATFEGPEGELGPTASMLIATEPYERGVRIGQNFQAEVPDWCGPSVEEVDTTGDPSEIEPSELVSLLGWNSNKPSRVSSIGNWLQCQEPIEGTGEGVDGPICGKWRRAPLFEVQTDNWECFCAVHWDPAHADCAVPQELDTDQVLKQLKYIEMLRPRLAAKRRRLDIHENSGSQDHAKDVRKIRNP